MSDIVTRLRDRAYSGKVPDRLSEEAADEIARLRGSMAALEQLSALDQELELSHGAAANPMIKGQQRTPGDCSRPHGPHSTLTDAEREAVERARRAFRDIDHNDMTMQQLEDYEALCGLLERL